MPARRHIPSNVHVRYTRNGHDCCRELPELERTGHMGLWSTLIQPPRDPDDEEEEEQEDENEDERDPAVIREPDEGE